MTLLGRRGMSSSPCLPRALLHESLRHDPTLLVRLRVCKNAPALQLYPVHGVNISDPASERLSCQENSSKVAPPPIRRVGRRKTCAQALRDLTESVPRFEVEDRSTAPDAAFLSVAVFRLQLEQAVYVEPRRNTRVEAVGPLLPRSGIQISITVSLLAVVLRSDNDYSPVDENPTGANL